MLIYKTSPFPEPWIIEAQGKELASKLFSGEHSGWINIAELINWDFLDNSRCVGESA